jgi:hypothetical protein
MTRYYKILQDVKDMTRYDKIWQDMKDMTRYYKILQDITRYYKMWQDMTRYNKIWHDMTRYDKILQDITRYDKIWQILHEERNVLHKYSCEDHYIVPLTYAKYSTSLQFMKILFVPHREQCIFIRNNARLIFYRRKVPVYCKNYTVQIIILREQNVKLFCVQQGSKWGNHWVLKFYQTRWSVWQCRWPGARDSCDLCGNPLTYLSVHVYTPSSLPSDTRNRPTNSTQWAWAWQNFFPLFNNHTQ